MLRDSILLILLSNLHRSISKNGFEETKIKKHRTTNKFDLFPNAY